MHRHLSQSRCELMLWNRGESPRKPLLASSSLHVIHHIHPRSLCPLTAGVVPLLSLSVTFVLQLHALRATPRLDEVWQSVRFDDRILSTGMARHSHRVSQGESLCTMLAVREAYTCNDEWPAQKSD